MLQGKKVASENDRKKDKKFHDKKEKKQKYYLGSSIGGDKKFNAL